MFFREVTIPESCSYWSIERYGAAQWKAGKYAVVIRNGPLAVKEEIKGGHPVETVQARCSIFPS